MFSKLKDRGVRIAKLLKRSVIKVVDCIEKLASLID